MFQEIIPILLRGSLRIKEIPYEELSHEEVAELVANERGVSIETFRDPSSETILKHSVYFPTTSNIKVNKQFSG